MSAPGIENQHSALRDAVEVGLRVISMAGLDVVFLVYFTVGLRVAVLVSFTVGFLVGAATLILCLVVGFAVFFLVGFAVGLPVRPTHVESEGYVPLGQDDTQVLPYKK